MEFELFCSLIRELDRWAQYLKPFHILSVRNPRYPKKGLRSQPSIRHFRFRPLPPTSDPARDWKPRCLLVHCSAPRSCSGPTAAPCYATRKRNLTFFGGLLDHAPAAATERTRRPRSVAEPSAPHEPWTHCSFWQMP